MASSGTGTSKLLRRWVNSTVNFYRTISDNMQICIFRMLQLLFFLLLPLCFPPSPLFLQLFLLILHLYQRTSWRSG
jgi:hypothetical protein